MGEERKLYKVLVGKPEGKRLLRRPRCRWEDAEAVLGIGNMGFCLGPRAFRGLAQT
jgi:hypothetical protein